MANNNIEVELRVLLEKGQKLNLGDLSFKGSYRDLDTYYELTRGWVSRIRKRGSRYFLTFKSVKQFGEGCWNEVEIPVTKIIADQMHEFFRSNGYIVKMVVDKVRKSYKKGEFELNLDVVRGLGKFAEVELIVDDKHTESAIKRIEVFMQNVGINPVTATKLGYVSLLEKSRQK